MSTPLANKTTFSSRMKMASTTVKPQSNQNNANNNDHLASVQPKTNGSISRFAPKTAIKPSTTTRTVVPPTTSRLVQPNPRISGTFPQKPTATTTSRNGEFAVPAINRNQRGTTAQTFVESRSSSKLSSTSTAATPRTSNSNTATNSLLRNGSSSVSRQNSLASQSSVHAATARKPLNTKPNYVPDTNSIRKGLAKFSNPIECQRQFQVLNSEIRQLSEINLNKDKQINQLQEQLDIMSKQTLGYATIVQYFAKKLKIDSYGLDLEKECDLLKIRVEDLAKAEAEHDIRLEAAVERYKNKLQMEQDLKENIKRELAETKEAHSNELNHLYETHKNTVDGLNAQHAATKSELESQIRHLEGELGTRTRELSELRKEYEILNDSFNKLEESLTRDKDARVKHFQDKANQLQKEVDSLNSVLEMRTEKMHVLEKDSILLVESQQDLQTAKDTIKNLRQKVESLEAAHEIKREKYENLLADSEKIAQELKRERRERRRLTMRTEQLEYALNESFNADNDISVLDQETVGT